MFSTYSNVVRRSSFHSIKQQALSVAVSWLIPHSGTESARNTWSVTPLRCEGGYSFWIAPSTHHFTARGSFA
jgi:hypothetical protein